MHQVPTGCELESGYAPAPSLRPSNLVASSLSLHSNDIYDAHTYRRWSPSGEERQNSRDTQTKRNKGLPMREPEYEGQLILHTL